jgi:hypothetical protein
VQLVLPVHYLLRDDVGKRRVQVAAMDVETRRAVAFHHVLT